ncbi:MAG TPA: TIGR03435 family protein, partial [Acidobacteriaceae bacterium]|nr:TIGR03435 family protein [Acidobacteriaceae bacterium]
MRRSTLILKLCVSLLFPAFCAYSQTAASDKPQPVPPTSFDVISIRPYVSNGTFQKGTISSGYLFSPTDRAANLIAMAYNVSEFQFVDAPSWTHSDLYTIVAKMDNPSDQDRIPLYLKRPSPNSPQSLAQQVFQQRLQALLADRFHLKVHMDKKDMSHFDLVVAKGGLKLPEADSDSCNPDLPDKNVHRGAVSFRC